MKAEFIDNVRRFEFRASFGANGVPKDLDSYEQMSESLAIAMGQLAGLHNVRLKPGLTTSRSDYCVVRPFADNPHALDAFGQLVAPYQDPELALHYSRFAEEGQSSYPIRIHAALKLLRNEAAKLKPDVVPAVVTSSVEGEKTFPLDASPYFLRAPADDLVKLVAPSISGFHVADKAVLATVAEHDPAFREQYDPQKHACEVEGRGAMIWLHQHRPEIYSHILDGLDAHNRCSVLASILDQKYPQANISFGYIGNLYRDLDDRSWQFFTSLQNEPGGWGDNRATFGSHATQNLHDLWLTASEELETFIQRKLDPALDTRMKQFDWHLATPQTRSAFPSAIRERQAGEVEGYASHELVIIKNEKGFVPVFDGAELPAHDHLRPAMLHLDRLYRATVANDGHNNENISDIKKPTRTMP